MAEARQPRVESPEDRFRMLYRAHYPQIYAYFRRRCDPEQAADGASDTFLTAWRRLDEVPEGPRAVAWIYGVARRVHANERRSQLRFDRLRRKVGAVGSEVGPTPESAFEEQAEREAVRTALAGLRPMDREVLQLAEWEDLSHREIAEVLGCKPHAVDQRIHRAYRRLGRALGEADETASTRGRAR